METSHSPQQLVIVFLVMLAAFYVQELPTSNVLQNSLPEWPFLFCLYFSVSSRYFFGVFSAFIIGMIQDVFLGTPTLGLHAGIYTLATFILISARMRFKHLSLASQSLIIGLLVLAKILLIGLYSAIIYTAPGHFWNVLSVPLSMLFWPGICLFFQFFSDQHSE